MCLIPELHHQARVGGNGHGDEGVCYLLGPPYLLISLTLTGPSRPTYIPFTFGRGGWGQEHHQLQVVLGDAAKL